MVASGAKPRISWAPQFLKGFPFVRMESTQACVFLIAAKQGEGLAFQFENPFLHYLLHGADLAAAKDVSQFAHDDGVVLAGQALHLKVADRRFQRFHAAQSGISRSPSIGAGKS